MVLILKIKWQGNIRLELSPQDGLFIVSKHTRLDGYKCMDRLQGGHKEQHTQKSFSSAVGSKPIWALDRRKKQYLEKMVARINI